MPSARDVRRALARVRAAMPHEKQVVSTQRNIRLGLERISRVVPQQQKWTGVHVGGTNGKGSICTLLSGLLKLAGQSHGTFTSPAVPERHNGITINGLYPNKRMYELEIEQIETLFRRITSGWTFATGGYPDDLTPFELETAAAFRIFNKMRVRYGVVEVGMGGATDATNAMLEKSVTVISKIGLDHQEYLGNTIEDIAKVKAGIMRPGVPCVVDDSNHVSVLNILREHASSIGTQISLSWKGHKLLEDIDTQRFQLEDYERQNLLCAVVAFRHLFPSMELDLNTLLASKPFMPGRMEQVDVQGLTGGSRQQPILVDGAHNMLGVQELAKHVDTKVRDGEKPVAWVLGLSASKSKPFHKLIETMVRPQDNVAFVEYAPDINDPPSVPAELGRDYVKSVISNEDQVYESDLGPGLSLQPAIQWACNKAGSGPVVLAGSLYLIREFFKLDGVKHQRRLKTRRPGRSQLFRYVKLSQERTLTPEETREFKQARRHWYLCPDRNPTFREVGEGQQPTPPPVPGKVRNWQRNAAYHNRQAESYAQSLESIERDIKSRQRDPAKAPPEAIEELERNASDLRKLRDKHLDAYDIDMNRVRGHKTIRAEEYLTYERIFGRPHQPKNPVYPFMEFEEKPVGKKGEDDTPSSGEAASKHRKNAYPFDLPVEKEDPVSEAPPSGRSWDGGEAPSRFEDLPKPPEEKPKVKSDLSEDELSFEGKLMRGRR